MQPLSPKDLLPRKAVDPDPLLEDEKAEESPVALERFQTLERIIRDSPLTSEPYLELANIYMGQQRWVDARRVLDSAIARFPDDSQVAFLREEALMARSQQLLTHAEKEHADEPTELTSASVERSRVELNVLRERVYRERMQRDPEQIELSMPWAAALEQLDRVDEAIQVLKKAVAVPKLRADAALQLGKLFERARRIPEALSAYRRSALFRVPPASPEVKSEALRRAAELAQRSNMVDSARRYLELLVELHPDDHALKTRLAEVRELPL